MLPKRLPGDDGVRPTEPDEFESKKVYGTHRVVYRDTEQEADGMQVRLSSDAEIDEEVCRYILADIFLGGAPSFYIKANDPSGVEAVRRYEDGFQITNIDSFERKQYPGGGVTIVHKGTDTAIEGMEVKLNTD
jgi:hypothetical protein